MIRNIGFIPTLTLTLILSLSITAFSQHKNQTTDWLMGLWHAKVDLRDDPGVVLNFDRNANGDPIGLLKSPDGIHSSKIEHITFLDDSVRFGIPGMGVTIQATFSDNSGIENAFLMIHGNRFPMTFKRLSSVPWDARLQTPLKPYPYVEEDVFIENEKASIKLAGTLTYPEKKGPSPAYILISGSGPQDRNETAFGHQPFLVLADHLTRSGITVLRMDDRGVWQSTGEFSSATIEDFASDVNAGIDYLKSRSDLEITQIGLIGHSEGGMIAPLVAAENKDVNSIIMLNAPTKHLFDADVLTAQKSHVGEASGDSEAKINVQSDWEVNFFKILKSSNDAASAEHAILEHFRSLSEQEREMLGTTEDKIKGRISYSFSPWFNYYLHYDQAKTLEKVSCPLLAIYGDMDTQCPSRVNISSLEEAMAKGNNTTYSVFEFTGINHMLQTAVTGLESEYATINETISLRVMETIKRWIHDRERGVDDWISCY